MNIKGPTTMMMKTLVARNLLANKVYDIEFYGFLSNHVKHAIIALDRLKASEGRIQEYWDTYTKLTPYSISIDKVPKDWDQVQPATLEQWKAWKGQKIHWQEQVQLLQDELDKRNGDTNQLVKDYVPKLLPGMLGALTHTIIHLGWAIDAESPWMILEGLAYLNFAYIGMDDNKLKGNVHKEDHPMTSLLRVAKIYHEQKLQTNWIETTKAMYDHSFHPELVPAGFQWHLAKVVDHPHDVAVELPTWINEQPLPDLWKNLYFTAVYLYLTTRDKDGNGNFIVLHLLSSLWGLEQTLHVIDNEAVTRKAIGHYYAGLVCLLSTASSGFPTVEHLQDIEKHYPKTKVDSPTMDWTSTVKAGIAEEEEHNIKLVYIMKELWNRYDNWNGFSEAAKSFTLTPNVGSGSSQSKETDTSKVEQFTA